MAKNKTSEYDFMFIPRYLILSYTYCLKTTGRRFHQLRWVKYLVQTTQLVSYIHRILCPEARGYDCIILQNCFDKGSRIPHILLLYL